MVIVLPCLLIFKPHLVFSLSSHLFCLDPLLLLGLGLLLGISEGFLVSFGLQISAVPFVLDLVDSIFSLLSLFLECSHALICLFSLTLKLKGTILSLFRLLLGGLCSLTGFFSLMLGVLLDALSFFSQNLHFVIKVCVMGVVDLLIGLDGGDLINELLVNVGQLGDFVTFVIAFMNIVSVMVVIGLTINNNWDVFVVDRTIMMTVVLLL